MFKINCEKGCQTPGFLNNKGQHTVDTVAQMEYERIKEGKIK